MGTHSWWHYTVVHLEDQTIGTMSQYPTQSHYPDTELTSPYHILLLLSATLGSVMYQFDKSLV